MLDVANVLGRDDYGIETALAEYVPDRLSDLGGRSVPGRRRHENLHAPETLPGMVRIEGEIVIHRSVAEGVRLRG
jgi:hypothetical protein